MEITNAIQRDDLAARCRSGEAQAFYEVYHRYAKTMLNSSIRILNHLADAEDAVQEAFAIAFNKIDTFTYKSSLEAWLVRISINKSLELLRQKRKIRWVDVDAIEIKQDGSAAAGDHGFRYSGKQVKEAIDRLPENYRIIFNLYAVDEIPQEDIAQMLQISHGNVRTIYHRAKLKIKEILQNEQG
ncbi:RNA polymerase sigma factor [Niabella drilacis]|uniref:RNA polymerase sigma-70 factor, ECF subfamily n=1 Tax=Niabella drilacis (strain DSM 25811 / CCM 8410 / CCUG 62505 / LMG 26954 / E90) TaxID=1285928 RepID=A0A1G6XN73_NIADE|nr:RNA polymerase sigma factor [Niabella drilacis]SDD78885.1 RNA polymerase sigma-70 factor, ECF subfamily [Niabella drilacis]